MIISTVLVGYGKVTYPYNSATLASFVVTPEFTREASTKKLLKTTKTIVVPATTTPKNDGYMYIDKLDAPDGCILLCQLQVRSLGASVRDGAVFIRVRESGPLISVTANLPLGGQPECPETHAAFNGRGDVLDLEDLAVMNIVPSDRYINAFMSEVEIAECFCIEELSSGREGKPIVVQEVNSAGETVMLVAPRARRNIRIRNPGS